MPPGHVNALFIQDASLLEVDSVMDAYAAAIKQGAFLLWNHPGWKSQQPDGIPRMYDIHKTLIEKGWLHGIEFFNSNELLSAGTCFLHTIQPGGDGQQR